ncbi:unnamed protein product [Linum trigynum]|uniref:ADP-ribosyl cyclase/cyclic ADP-ribose hydrolase n=1 Tax=Linum trigynum TaxID=586398 RepID=A0AAV2C756_9ROSI
MAASSSSAAANSVADSRGQMKYDVFLSFRGKDTRHNFTSHLFDALCRKKIKCFIDDNLQRGEEITPSLLKAIEESRISVVIFSKNYAASPWCVDELVKILDCRERYGQVVLPVFYHVDPSDVEQQIGSFADAISVLELNFKVKMDKVPSWRSELTKAANVSGWDSQVIRPESRLVNEIVEDILKKLTRAPRGYSNGLVGIESRVGRIKAMLHMQSSDVRFLGIWGMGGVGKTTIAEAVFSDIFAQYEGCCFLANIREESKRHGLVHLKGQLLSEILVDQNKHSSTMITIGSTFTVDRIRRKRVLLVLDDVNDVSQVEFLIGSTDLFGPGSRVILTSRDKQVLKSWVGEMYEVERLDQDEALLLFCYRAFKGNCPKEDFVEQSSRVVTYSQGNPLVIKVLGSFFLDRTQRFWESALAQLQRTIRPEIYDVLMISFDALADEEKSIFLDVACFFNGQKIDFVKGILDGCGFGTDTGICVLTDKCLITVSENRIWIHDLLQEMAHEVVRQESVKDLGKRSRLWRPNDVYRVLTRNQGTEQVEGIFLDVSEISHMELSCQAFSRMHNLRLLKIIIMGPGMDHISTFPFNFRAENLVHINLAYSNIKQLWGGVQALVNLKEVDLSDCKNLNAIPDMSQALNLEIMNLANCTSMVELPSSVQHLVKLTDLDLRGCSSLTGLPECLNVKSLKTLNLSSCSNLQKCPEIMGCVAYLNLNDTEIEELPQSIAYLSRLAALNLKDCKRLHSLPSNLFLLESLAIADFSGCSSIMSLPSIAKSIKYLYLSGTAIVILPCWIGNLSNLSSLDLTNCKRIKNLPDTLSEANSLEKLILRGCSSIRQFPKISRKIKELYLDETGIEEIPSSVEHLSQLVELHLQNCKSFRVLPSHICKLKSLQKLNLSGCSKFEKFPAIREPMKSFRYLYLDGTAIRNFPVVNDLENLENLSMMELGNCRKLSLRHLLYFVNIAGWWNATSKSLFRLSLNDCNISMVPDGLCALTSLEVLDLSGNMFDRLPFGMKGLSQLQQLSVKNCRRLVTLPELPTMLSKLEADNCQSLARVSIYSADHMNSFDFSFTNCFSLDKIACKNILAYALLKIQHYSEGLRNQMSFLPAVESTFCCPGGKVPEWFTHHSSGHSLVMQLPSNWTSDGFAGLTICAVLAFEEHFYESGVQLKCTFHFSTQGQDSQALHHCYFCGSAYGGKFLLSNHLLFWLRSQHHRSGFPESFAWKMQPGGYSVLPRRPEWKSFARLRCHCFWGKSQYSCKASHLLIP